MAEADSTSNASREDARALAELAAAAFTKPWTERDFAQALSDLRTVTLVLREAGKILGYAVLRVVVDEMEVLDLAVAPQHQRRGLGRRLLRAALSLARSRGVRVAFLEVRESNEAARRLYESEGFAARARRFGYYSEPREDAVVMHAALVTEEETPQEQES